MEQKIPAAAQLAQLEKSLLQAFVDKHDAEAKVKAADEKILGIRNLLAGVPVGQQIQKEIAAATPSPTP
jgi:hypothetical protein